MAIIGHGFSVYMERIVFVIMSFFLYNRIRILEQRQFLYMEEKSNVTKLTQKDYQKKYDEKTQSVTIKYTPADMPDFDRMMKYLDRTGKSRSSFIKELINDFFEKEKYYLNEERIAKEFCLYAVDDDVLEKLKNTVGDSKYNVFVKYCASIFESEFIDAYTERGCAFENWINELIDDIESGDINIDISDKEFERIIDRNMADNNFGDIYFG